MIAVYNSGARGTHTMLISQPYDARDGILYWCDSNFSNTRIDGVRYGYVRARQSWAMPMWRGGFPTMAIRLRRSIACARISCRRSREGFDRRCAAARRFFVRTGTQRQSVLNGKREKEDVGNGAGGG